MSEPRVVSLPEHRDARGVLCSIEAGRDVPFAVERVYWVSGVPGDADRGGHAHRTVSEMIVAAAGSFTVRWEGADGRGEATLRAPGTALVLPPLYWRTLHDFSAGAVCLVLASGPYDAAEYVNDRAELEALCARP